MTTKINYNSALEYLIKANPIVAKAASEVIDEWNPDPVPSTITMSVIGRALVTNRDAIPDSDFAKVFDVVERLLVDGDEFVQNSVATGLLEAVLAAVSDSSSSFNRIVRFFGAESKKYCRAWDRFTGCTTSGLD